MTHTLEQIKNYLQFNNYTKVRILAVSKGQSIDKIKNLYDIGQRDFAESYTKEWLAKKEQLTATCPNIRWHFIGRIQSNKIPHIVDSYLIHSLSSIKHAKLIGDFCQKHHKIANILLQVNICQDTNKAGFLKDDMESAILAIQQIANIKVHGLTTILAKDLSISQKNSMFANMYNLRNFLQNKYQLQLPELSMGMSDDYQQSTKHGSTWIRLGTILFGKKDYDV